MEEKILLVNKRLGLINMKAAVDIIQSMGGIGCGVAPMIGGLLFKLKATKEEFDTFMEMGIIEWY